MNMSSRKAHRSVPEPTPSANAWSTEDLGVLLTMALAAFKDRLHAHLTTAGFDDLGPSFGFVFRSLAEQPLSLTELAALLGISSQGALKIVVEMSERGYVERRDDSSDQRVRRVALTRRGRSALREARRFHTAAERQLVELLGPRQVASARTVLGALAAEKSPNDPSWIAAGRPF
jgi:DNA-binding MarR family transcriptional regulator